MISLLDRDGKGYITQHDLQRVMATRTSADLLERPESLNRTSSFGSETGDMALVGSYENQQKRMEKLNEKIARIIEQVRNIYSYFTKRRLLKFPDNDNWQFFK